MEPCLIIQNFTILPDPPMLKWLITLCVTVLIAGFFLPRLAALLKIGHIPGDVRWRRGPREYHFPFGSTIVLSLLAGLVMYLLRFL